MCNDDQAYCAQSPLFVREVIFNEYRYNSELCFKIVFGVLIVDWELLLESLLFIDRAMPFRYSQLRGLDSQLLHTMTTMPMIAESQSQHASSDNRPRIPLGYCIHPGEVFKWLVPEKNQAIHWMISCQSECLRKLELRYLAIHLH